MNTCTAERPFARKQLNFHQQKTCFLLMKIKQVLIWSAIHSAVHVSMGEADEIADLLIAVFAASISLFLKLA
jgi:hypothetical protein